MAENFLGLRGTLDWATNEEPQNWRQGVFYLNPNGKAQLLGILSQIGEFGTMPTSVSKQKGIPSSQYNWWTQKYEHTAMDVAGVYKDSGLSVAYSSGGVKGDYLYLKGSESDVTRFRTGHQALVICSSDPTAYATAEVIDVVRNGSSSYLQVSLLEDDDNSSYHNLSNADRVLAVGNVNSQGGRLPEIIDSNPIQLYNMPQIFRTPFGLTNSAMTNDLRTGDPYTRVKYNAAVKHAAEIEWAIITSTMSSNVGSNGKPKYTMDGIVSMIKKYAPQNVFDYRTDSDFTGKNWLSGGRDWIMKILENMGKYGSGEGYLLTCGGEVLTAIDRLATDYGYISLRPGDLGYGIKVTTWMSPHGDLYFRRHPLISLEKSLANMAIGIPKGTKIEYLPVRGRDTHVKENRQANDEDARIDEFFTECTIMLHNPDEFFVAYGFGYNNVL